MDVGDKTSSHLYFGQGSTKAYVWRKSSTGYTESLLAPPSLPIDTTDTYSYTDFPVPALNTYITTNDIVKIYISPSVWNGVHRPALYYNADKTGEEIIDITYTPSAVTTTGWDGWWLISIVIPDGLSTDIWIQCKQHNYMGIQIYGRTPYP